MNRTLLTTVASAAVLVAISVSAQAAIVQVVYTGTVSSGVDTIGVFGQQGASLAGDVFKVTYIFDTTRGTIVSSPTENSATGGAAIGVASPSLGTIVEINNEDIALTGNNFAQIYGYNDGGFSQQSHESDFVIDNGKLTYSLSVNNGITDFDVALPAIITGPLSYALGVNDVGSGSFSMTITNDATGATVGSISASFANATLTVKTVNRVPAEVSEELSSLGHY